MVIAVNRLSFCFVSFSSYIVLNTAFIVLQLTGDAVVYFFLA